jgi:hypothetical protein
MHCRIAALTVGLLLTGRAWADASTPDAPRLVVDNEKSVSAHGLPAVSPDGQHAAWVEPWHNYDDSSGEVLVIEPVPPAKRSSVDLSLVLREDREGAVPTMSVAQIAEAVKRANELVRRFNALPQWQMGAEGRWRLGGRQLTYSRKSGVLEVTVGKRVVLRQTISQSRQWQCCGFAGPEDGSCKRPPETLDEVWGDERALVVKLGYKDGPHGCETDHYVHVYRLK